MPALRAQQEIAKLMSEVTKLTNQELIERHADFIEGIARCVARNVRSDIDLGDLISCGQLGLIEAYERYDSSSRAAFTTFAYNRVRGEMLDWCRKQGWRSRSRSCTITTMSHVNDYLADELEVSASAPPSRSLDEQIDRVADKVGDVLTIIMASTSDLEAILVEYEPPQDLKLERKAKNIKLNKAIAQLELQEQVLIKRHHFFGESLTDIANDLNKSKSWCSRMHARAISRLRELLEQPDSG